MNIKRNNKITEKQSNSNSNNNNNNDSSIFDQTMDFPDNNKIKSMLMVNNGEVISKGGSPPQTSSSQSTTASSSSIKKPLIPIINTQSLQQQHHQSLFVNTFESPKTPKINSINSIGSNSSSSSSGGSNNSSISGSPLSPTTPRSPSLSQLSIHNHHQYNNNNNTQQQQQQQQQYIPLSPRNHSLIRQPPQSSLQQHIHHQHHNQQQQTTPQHYHQPSLLIPQSLQLENYDNDNYNNNGNDEDDEEYDNEDEYEDDEEDNEYENNNSNNNNYTDNLGVIQEMDEDNFSDSDPDNISQARPSSVDLNQTTMFTTSVLSSVPITSALLSSLNINNKNSNNNNNTDNISNNLHNIPKINSKPNISQSNMSGVNSSNNSVPPLTPKKFTFSLPLSMLNSNSNNNNINTPTSAATSTPSSSTSSSNLPTGSTLISPRITTVIQAPASSIPSTNTPTLTTNNNSNNNNSSTISSLGITSPRRQSTSNIHSLAPGWSSKSIEFLHSDMKKSKKSKSDISQERDDTVQLGCSFDFDSQYKQQQQYQYQQAEEPITPRELNKRNNSNSPSSGNSNNNRINSSGSNSSSGSSGSNGGSNNNRNGGGGKLPTLKLTTLNNNNIPVSTIPIPPPPPPPLNYDQLSTSIDKQYKTIKHPLTRVLSEPAIRLINQQQQQQQQPNNVNNNNNSKPKVPTLKTQQYVEPSDKNLFSPRLQMSPHSQQQQQPSINNNMYNNEQDHLNLTSPLFFEIASRLRTMEPNKKKLILDLLSSDDALTVYQHLIQQQAQQQMDSSNNNINNNENNNNNTTTNETKPPKKVSPYHSPHSSPLMSPSPSPRVDLRDFSLEHSIIEKKRPSSIRKRTEQQQQQQIPPLSLPLPQTPLQQLPPPQSPLLTPSLTPRVNLPTPIITSQQQNNVNINSSTSSNKPKFSLNFDQLSNNNNSNSNYHGGALSARLPSSHSSSGSISSRKVPIGSSLHPTNITSSSSAASILVSPRRFSTPTLNDQLFQHHHQQQQQHYQQLLQTPIQMPQQQSPNLHLHTFDLQHVINNNEKSKQSSKDQSSSSSSSSSSHPQSPVQSSILIPNPSGRVITINISSTWGDQNYVGLSGIDIFDSNGSYVKLKDTKSQIKAFPSDLNDSGSNSNSNNNQQSIDRIMDGFPRTCDDNHLWLATFTPGQINTITITLDSKITLSLIRIWNYNKSRIHSSRGAKDIEIKIDNSLIIFRGTIKKSPGILKGCEQHCEYIVFTNRDDILNKIEENDPFSPSSWIQDDQSLFVKNDYFNSNYLQNNQHQDGEEEEGDEEVSDEIEENEEEEEDYQNIGVEDEFQQLQLEEEYSTNQQEDERKEHEQFYNQQQQYSNSINNGTPPISPIKNINYLERDHHGSQSSSSSGIKTPSSPKIPSKPNSSSTTTSSSLSSSSMSIHSNSNSTYSTTNEFESTAMIDFIQPNHYPKGRKLKFSFQSTWGDRFYMGLTSILVFDNEYKQIQIQASNITAHPKDINDVPGHSGDYRTLDKLIDGHNITTNDRHMWLIPFFPSKEHVLTIDLGSTFSISCIRVWNYNKSLDDCSRGAKKVLIYLDGQSLSTPTNNNNGSGGNSGNNGFIFRKAPGNCIFDFGQTISFYNWDKLNISSSNQPSSSCNDSGSSIIGVGSNNKIFEYSSGFVLKFVFISNYGDRNFIGLHAIEIYDQNDTLIKPNKSSILSNDTKNSYRLVNNSLGFHDNEGLLLPYYSVSFNNTPYYSQQQSSSMGSGSSSSSSSSPSTLNSVRGVEIPSFSKESNVILFYFDSPITVSKLKIWNYFKNISQSVKEYSVYLDDLLINQGILLKPTIENQNQNYITPQDISLTFEDSITHSKEHHQTPGQTFNL